jgi:hypothetical protein
MESIGVFRKPVFNILEDDFEVILANAAHVRNVPGLTVVPKPPTSEREKPIGNSYT